MRSFPFIVSILLLLAGCAQGPALVGRPDLDMTRLTDLPAPTVADLNTAQRTQVIGPYDKIEIDVFGIEDLRREVQADGSGRISFPLVGSVDAAGLTPAQLSDVVRTRLGRYVRDPQVTVNIKEAVSQTVTVEGQVREPGQYPVLGRMTLIRAVAVAKGTTEFARSEEVVVFRTVGNRSMAGLYDLSSIRRGIYADPEIFPNDVIVVGDSSSRRFVRNLLQAAPILTAPLIAVLSNRN